MADFTVGSVSYRSAMLDGEVQLNILKRLLPTFTALAAAAPDLLAVAVATAAATGASDEPSDAPDPQSRGMAIVGPVGKALAPVAAELSALSDKDVAFIVDACMDVTSRIMPDGKAMKIKGPSGILSNRDDATFAARIGIAAAVVRENFRDMLASFGIDLESVIVTAAAGGIGKPN